MKSYTSSIALRHAGCFSESSGRFPELRMVVLDARIVSSKLYYNRMAFLCPDRQYFERYARRLSSHPNIKELRVLHRFRAGELFVGVGDLQIKNAAGSIRRVIGSLGKSVVVHPNIEHSGIENVSITTTEKETLKDFYGRMDNAFEIIKMSKGEFKEGRFRRELERGLFLHIMREAEEFDYLFTLTQRQREAVRIACKSGGVRGAAIRKMAGEMGVAPSTFRQHLDSGLFKLMPLLSKIVSSVPSED